MTLLEDGLRALGSRHITWARVDDGFHVASTDGAFVGSVDTTSDGHYVAFDGSSTPIGRYASLSEAKAAVTSWEPSEVRVRRSHVDRALLPAATASAVLAGSAAIAAGMLLPRF